jgi:tight adherence protein B
MSMALLLGALAAVLWPGAIRRHRLGGATGLPNSPLSVLVSELQTAPMAGLLAAALAAVASTALVAALAGLVAFAGVRAWLGRRRDDRTDAELSALTEGLGALAADLRSGRSLEAATDAAVAACADEVCGRGLALAIRAPGAGPLAEQGAAMREALHRISAAVLLSTRTGCSLAAVASAVEDDLRARQRHRRAAVGHRGAPRQRRDAGRAAPVGSGHGQRSRRRPLAGAHDHRNGAGPARGGGGARVDRTGLVSAPGPSGGAVTG